MNTANKTFFFSDEVRVGALAAILCGIFHLALHFLENKFIPGTVAFGFARFIQPIPLSIIASYLAGLFSFVLLLEYYRLMPNKVYKTSREAKTKILMVTLIIASLVFYTADLLISNAVSTSSGLVLRAIPLRVDFAFSVLSGLYVYLFVMRTMADLKAKTHS